MSDRRRARAAGRIVAPHWRLVDTAALGWAARWPNFTLAGDVLYSRGDGSVRLVTAALDRLQAARADVGRPFTINSAYRDPIYNALKGGAPLSSHKAGHAFDIALAGHDRDELLAACRRAGFTGFGYYQTFLHVDCGRPRFWYAGERSKALWTG